MPAASDEVVLDGGSARDLTVEADGDLTVRSWTQTAAFTRTVSFATRYAGPFATFTVTDGVRLDGGTWTHRANASTQTYRLAFDVGADLMIGAGARIDVVGRGYAEGAGPGRSTLAHQGASHGGSGVGAGSDGLGSSPPTYGSFTRPTDLGSGGGPFRTGTSRGGGAVRVMVAGAASIDGTVDATGACAAEYAGCAAGGSIWISAGSMSGSGSLTADGGSTTWTAPGGRGGRIAVDLAAGTELGGVTLRARGGAPATRVGINHAGGAGTVYVEVAPDATGGGLLVVDNGDQPVGTTTRTSVPDGSTWIVRHLVLRGGGQLSVESGATLDLSQATITADDGTRRSGIRAAGGTLVTPTSLTIAGWWLLLDGPITAAGSWTVGPGGGISQTPSTAASITRSSLDLLAISTSRRGV